MNRFILDVEANGLLDTATKIHCLVLYDMDEEKEMVFRPEVCGSELANYLYSELPSGSEIIGHNIFGYDLPLIRKLYGIDYEVSARGDSWNNKDVTFIDTFQLSSFLSPDRLGGHSLDNLAKLAGSYKQGYTGGFDKWNIEMEKYCIQDTVATAALYKYLLEEAKRKYDAKDSH